MHIIGRCQIDTLLYSTDILEFYKPDQSHQYQSERRVQTNTSCAKKQLKIWILDFSVLQGNTLSKATKYDV